jgi:hypothetical protein
VKDGIQPLVGLIETDWLPFPFTMNWIFTRPGTVKFEKGEPFCFITPGRAPQGRGLPAGDPDAGRPIRTCGPVRRLGRQARRLQHPPPQGDPGRDAKEAWQRFYFKGEYPEEVEAPAPAAHVNKRRLKAPKVG